MQKYKKNRLLTVISAFAILLSSIFIANYFFQDSTDITITMPSGATSEKSRLRESQQTPPLPEIEMNSIADGGIDNHKLENDLHIATNNKIVDSKVTNKANEFYSTVFAGMVNESTDNYVYETYSEATIGEKIQVEDYFQRGPSTLLIPHISGGKVIAISMFRKFNGYEYSPARMIDVSSRQWESFPPISIVEAETILVNKLPNAYSPIPGFVHVDNITPNYQFFIPSEEKIIYLVNAYTGEIDVIPADYYMPIDIEERPPLFLQESGLLGIDEQKIASWSPENVAKLKSDVDKSNRAIKDGLLKIGSDMSVIYDNRPQVAPAED